MNRWNNSLSVGNGSREVPVFAVGPMTEEHAMEICRWRYEPPYDMYNWDSWSNMVKTGYEFANPDIRRQQYRSVTAEGYGLCGFAQLFPMINVTRLGLGMRPDLCGKGYGASFVRAIVRTAQREAPGKEIDLEVITTNIRAIKTYEKAGFIITDQYEKPTEKGTLGFYCMVYDPAKDMEQQLKDTKQF